MVLNLDTVIDDSFSQKVKDQIEESQDQDAFIDLKEPSPVNFIPPLSKDISFGGEKQ